jgi:hypothetical protein
MCQCRVELRVVVMAQENDVTFTAVLSATVAGAAPRRRAASPAMIRIPMLAPRQ